MSASPDGPRQEPRKSPQQPLRGGKSANLAQPSFRTLSKLVRSFGPTLPRKPSQPQPNEPKPAPINQNERPRPDDLRPRKSRLSLRRRSKRRPAGAHGEGGGRRPPARPGGPGSPTRRRGARSVSHSPGPRPHGEPSRGRTSPGPRIPGRRFPASRSCPRCRPAVAVSFARLST
jgi:hypothetical protein